VGERDAGSPGKQSGLEGELWEKRLGGGTLLGIQRGITRMWVGQRSHKSLRSERGTWGSLHLFKGDEWRCKSLGQIPVIPRRAASAEARRVSSAFKQTNLLSSGDRGRLRAGIRRQNQKGFRLVSRREVYGASRAVKQIGHCRTESSWNLDWIKDLGDIPGRGQEIRRQDGQLRCASWSLFLNRLPGAARGKKHFPPRMSRAERGGWMGSFASIGRPALGRPPDV